MRTTQRVSRRFHPVVNNLAAIQQHSRETNPMGNFGISAMGFPDKNSAVRSDMASKHAIQSLNLIDPEFPYVFGGAEQTFGQRSSWNQKTKGNFKLMKTFVKYPEAPNSVTLYIFKNLDNNKYYGYLYEPSVNLNECYGFEVRDCIRDKFKDGDVLPKDTPIYQSSSFRDGLYNNVRNFRTMYTIIPDITEDAVVVSDYVMDSMGFKFVYKISIEIGNKSFLLNSYGNDKVYKPFPDIGEEINDDIIMAIRENALWSSRAEARVQHLSDKKLYGTGIITDIDIKTNIDIPNEQFNYYANAEKEWYSNIYNYLKDVIDDPELDDTCIHDIYSAADKYLQDAKWVNEEYTINTRITFTVTRPFKACVGQKMAGRMGNKSVISEIRAREDMPITDDGRPIDVIQNGIAPVSRIIAFTLYECEMTFMAERLHQNLNKRYSEGLIDMEEYMRLVFKFINIFNEEEATKLRAVYESNKQVAFQDVFEGPTIYLHEKPLSENIRDRVIRAKQEPEFKGIFKKYIIYSKLKKRRVACPTPAAIGYMSFWCLKQEPTKAMSAVATGRTTAYDNPVKTKAFSKNLRQFSDNAIKFGEYDTYLEIIALGPKMFSKVSTYYRGSQYTPESMLSSQLSDIKIDTTKWNKFPQLDNLRNALEFNGIAMYQSLFSTRTCDFSFNKHKLMIGNHKVEISMNDLRYLLWIYAHYKKIVSINSSMMEDLYAFEEYIIRETDVFSDLLDDKVYVLYIFILFENMLPILLEMKEYA